LSRGVVEVESKVASFSPAAMAPLSSYNIDRGYRALVSDEARLTQLRARFGGYIGRR
jgi:hypothetical protein